MLVKYLMRIGKRTSGQYCTVASATFETDNYKLYKLNGGPSSKVTCTKEEALKFHKHMYTIRKMEATASTLYKEKMIRGFLHLCSGQEAVVVGMRAALRDQDVGITAYRVHGWVYAMGLGVLDILAELAGRSRGNVRGKGGSMHMYTSRLFGGNGIVGGQVPLGTGMALALKLKGSDGICVVLYGDGAANQGQVFEAYNMAALWRLPTLFVCENNGYGMGTSTFRSSASTEYYKRGHYLPGLQIDGMDVLAMREATRYALAHLLNGGAPLIMEAVTYRYYGHSMSDPGTSYRSREEIQKVRQTRDPITKFKEKIIAAALVTADELKAIEKEVTAHIEKQVDEVRRDKELPVEELWNDIYAHNLMGDIRDVVPWSHRPHRNTRSKS